MTNADMKTNRFLNIHTARIVYSKVISTLTANGAVQFVTPLRATEFHKKHASMVRIVGHRVQIQSGRAWLTVVESGMVLVCIRYGRSK